MSLAEKIPWQEMPLTAAECAQLWEMSPEWFLASVACLPTFPERMTAKPVTWKAGEVIEWRDANRASRRVRRRKSGSR